MSFTPAPAPTPAHVTQLLVAWWEGNASALDQLVPLVEAELRRLARRYLRRERPGHVLQTTALVNEFRFFGGLTLDEIAEVLGVAPITVSREWAKARAWLHREVATQ